MPKDISFHPIHTPKANELADLNAAKCDLVRSLEFGEELEKLDPLSGNTMIQESLSISMAVKYIRAHKGGIRKNINRDILKLSQKQNELHEEIKAYRDKHIAHAVSELDQDYATAQIAYEKDKEPEFRGVGLFSRSNIPVFIGDGLAKIIDLIKYQIEKIDEEISIRRQKLKYEFQKIEVQNIIDNGPIPPAFDQRDISKNRIKKNLQYKEKELT